MIPLFKVFMSEDVHAPLASTLSSGFITQGPRVEAFEESLRTTFSYPHILTLNSATSGLTLALRMIKERLRLDTFEVLTVPLTCMATNVPILANGLRIKWVDVDKDTGLIDLSDLEAKLSESTRVIMFVHWGGYPVDNTLLEGVLDRAEARLGFRPFVIEDCAHAYLSKFKGQIVGTSGHFAVYSLQAIKHLTTGDGGLLFCPDAEFYAQGKLLRWYGIDRDKRNYKGKDLRLEADVEQWGYKFHMNDINATLGLYNMPHVPGLIARARENAIYYDNNIDNPKIRLVHPYSEEKQSAYWLYTVFVDEKQRFIDYMKEQNIMASQVHQRNDVHSCFKEFATPLPNLDQVEKQIVCIPVGWWVTPEQREHIVNACNRFA